MKLYFLRHGIAADRRDWVGRDEDRPLTPEGRMRMTAVARAIGRLDLHLDVILTSSHRRAHESAEILLKQCANNPRLEVEPRLAPGFGLEKLKLLLKHRSDFSKFLLVGHEPDFSMTISQIVGGASLVLKKAGLARIDINDPERCSGVLVWLVPPKVLLGKPVLVR